MKFLILFSSCVGRMKLEEHLLHMYLRMCFVHSENLLENSIIFIHQKDSSTVKLQK